MNAWIVFFGGFCLGFGSILAIGAYVYFRDFHGEGNIGLATMTKESINKDVLRALASDAISSSDEEMMSVGDSETEAREQKR